MPRSRVLIVEDEPLIAMLLQDWLDDLGYDVLGPAHTVDQALALIKTSTPDAAILDIVLGGTDSTPVADELRARNVPFAFASGRDDRTSQSRHGMVPMLAKPYDEAALTSVMAKLLPVE